MYLATDWFFCGQELSYKAKFELDIWLFVYTNTKEFRIKLSLNATNIQSRIFIMWNLQCLTLSLAFIAGAIAHGGIVSYNIDGKEYIG